MKNRQQSILTFLGVVYLAATLLISSQEALADVQNGGFESGATIWTENSSHGLLPLIFETGLVQLPPQGGTFGAWLCGAPNEISSLSQQVIVPLGNPFLTYWRWIDSFAPDGLHEGQILVNGNIIDKFNLSQTTDTHGWSHQALDLKNFQGQLITLEFRGACNSPDERISNLFLDSFAFQSTGLLQLYLPTILRN